MGAARKTGGVMITYLGFFFGEGIDVERWVVGFERWLIGL